MVLITKNHIFRKFFEVFSGTAQDFEKEKKSYFSLGSLEYTTKISIICHKQKVYNVARPNNWYFDFTCRSEVTLNPCISAANQDFENKKAFLM